jgi:tetratricopeptide (TPR) repeat protein
MGEVFRALDQTTGEAVAVKVLLERTGRDTARFEREARVLAELAHPSIVRYLAHGVTPSGEPYLAMEWLDGEDLWSRLMREGLTVAETLTLGSRVAKALAWVHARGVIHRDLKPNNLFLVAGDLGQVKLLDFGIARLGSATRITRTGMVMGTPGYIAPEQARSDQPLDARADVFSLGCVLYECLTGRPAFAGDHLMAILAKILFDEPPRVRELRPEVPAGLDALVARMLSKEPRERLRDGAAVAEALAVLAAGGELPEVSPSAPGTRPAALGGGERRALSVVLIGWAPRIDVDAVTVGATQATAENEALRRAAEACGGRLEHLADGSIVVTLAGVKVATDQAALSARAALSLRRHAPGRPIALATGRVTGRLPVGDAIDRAAKILVRCAPQPGEAPIALDEVTAGLLDARFEVRETETGLWLYGEQDLAEGARTLLGKATPCVGRDRELSQLEATFTECVEERIAQAVLVTAPAGVGKSRLAHELLQRVRQRSDEVAVWIGRGDSMRAGSAFGLLGQALRGACGIRDGEPLEQRREKLRAKIAEHVALADQRRVAEFLGEIVGTPMPDDDSAPLRAARQDAQLMGEQMRRAWEDFVAAESAARPIVLVLEDLHWGDLPTVRSVDAALRTLKDRIFLVLSLARPEVHDLFPQLWAERRMQEIRLAELTGKASKRLVRQVLGDHVSAEATERLVKQADGNAFYLEELIRAVAEGKGDTLPETVLAMVEARLSRLEGEARRVLRAASVFGEVGWESATASLLGGAMQSTLTGQWLSKLVEREVLVHRPESRFPGEREFAFRHALLREGAYAMLTEEDRKLGHRLAGEWLVEQGESAAIVLAEHFERGGEPARAARFYLRAAEQANQAGDTDTALACGQRGLRCSPPDEVRLSLLHTCCEANVWRSEWSTAATYADEVMSLSTPGSAPWAGGALAKLSAAMQHNQLEVFMATQDVLRRVDPSPDAVSAVAFALATATFLLDSVSQFDAAQATRARLNAIVTPVAEHTPVAHAWMNMPYSTMEPWTNEDPWAGLKRSEAARALFLEANHQRGGLLAQVFVGMNAWYLGALDQAEKELRGTMIADEEFGLVSSLRTSVLIGLLIDRGRLEEAHQLSLRMVEAGRARNLPPHEGRGRWSLAEVLRRSGDLEEAAHEASVAFDLLLIAPLDQAATRVTLAAVRLAQGRAVEARTAAEEALNRYDALRGFGFRGAFARLVHFEALYATGAHEAAREAILKANERLHTNAAKIGDPVYQKSFLENVPENARTLELAKEWLARPARDPPLVQTDLRFDAE